MMPPSVETVVDVAAPSRQARALWLVFADYPPQNRAGQVAATLSGTNQGRLSLAGLIAAHRDRHLVGAIWGQAMPGRIGVVWPAQLVEHEPESTALELHDTLNRHFAGLDTYVLQSSLANADGLSAARLRADGFSHLADVLYLAANVESPCEIPDTLLEFEPYAEHKYSRLADVVRRTYAGTMDCPALNGVRSLDDVLEGYRNTGQFSPDRWLFVRNNGEDVGCLLLTDHAQQNQWELIYMGLSAEARGRRWGREIAGHALLLARQSQRQRVVLAVDAANAPALGMYRSLGFEAWDRRSVFLKILKRS